MQYGRKKIQDHDSKYITEPVESSSTSKKMETAEDKDKEPEDIDGDDDSEDADPGRFYVTNAQVTTLAFRVKLPQHLTLGLACFITEKCNIYTINVSNLQLSFSIYKC